MTQRFLVIHMTDSSGAGLDDAEAQRMFASWQREGVESGRLGEGSPVAGRDLAASVAVRDGEVLISDGPFPELKEWFAGFDLIEAESLDEAVAYMAKHPGAVWGRILVLPLAPLGWEEDAAAS